MSDGETIAAPASGQGRAGIAVIRISGSRARTALETMAGGAPPPRRAALRRIVDPRTGETLDRGLVLWMPGPASFTGEDMAELHVHGGRSVVAGILAALIEGCGCRPADPGEFTRRAFANGKLDLAAVEGLADLIDAETAAQRRQALLQLDGALGRQTELWSERLLAATAWIEAALDFSDEADVPGSAVAAARTDIQAVAAEIGHALATDAGRGERLRDGFAVAIAGPPNAGKSTLLNALAQRDIAIVSPIAGTTRDLLEVRLDLGGLPIRLVDMAGLRDSSDPIEMMGIARAHRQIEQADLVLWLVPLDMDRSVGNSPVAPHLAIGSKADMDASADSDAKYGELLLKISAATGAGLDTLLAEIRARAEATIGVGDSLLTRARHRAALADAQAHLIRAEAGAAQGLGEELVADDLRRAVRALGRITGRVDVEDVLGVIFARFCIGK
jgi:tRNA modification GTPase